MGNSQKKKKIKKRLVNDFTMTSFLILKILVIGFVTAYALFSFVILVKSVFTAKEKDMVVTVNCPKDPTLRKAVLKQNAEESFIVACSEKSTVFDVTSFHNYVVVVVVVTCGINRV